MKAIIIKSYEFSTVFLPYLIAYIALNRRSFKLNMSGFKRFLIVSLLPLYVFFVFHFTDVGTIYHLIRIKGAALTPDKITLLPFFAPGDIRERILNIFMFVPFGFILPLIWRYTAKIRYILFYGLSFSLLIELSQLLNYRTSDINDLIMNTSGALIGYAAFKVFSLLFTKNESQQISAKHEVLIYIGAMFLGHFLFYNGLGLARILYG